MHNTSYGKWGETVTAVPNGSKVSRWTMVHFECSIVALLLAQTLLVFGFADPVSGLRAPAALIVVHLLTLGWLSLLMLGALYQFVPVITNTTLYSQRLPLYSLLAISLGLAGMLAGFLALGGMASIARAWLPIGGGLVLTGFGLALTNLAATLYRVKMPLPARFVAFGLAFLLLTAFIGFGFALTFGLPRPSSFLLALTSRGLSLHIAAGLAGWFMLTAMGVSYRLLSMFMLAPDEPRCSSHAALILTVTGLAIMIAAAACEIWGGFELDWIQAIGILLACFGIACYVADIIRFYRTRTRRLLELNSTTAMAAISLTTLAVLAGAVAVAQGSLERFGGAIGYLLLMGGLTGLGLSQLYKIIPFLTWLEVFGAKLGKGPVPRIQDLVNERRAKPWYVLYFTSAVLASGALAMSNVTLFKVFAALQLMATALITAELWRARHPDPNTKPTPIRPAAARLSAATPSVRAPLSSHSIKGH